MSPAAVLGYREREEIWKRIWGLKMAWPLSWELHPSTFGFFRGRVILGQGNGPSPCLPPVLGHISKPVQVHSPKLSVF